MTENDQLTPYPRLSDSCWWHQDLEEKNAENTEAMRRGRYVVARNRIPKGSLLIHVPQERCLMANSMDSEIKQFLKHQKQFNSLFTMALTLLHEVRNIDANVFVGKMSLNIPCACCMVCRWPKGKRKPSLGNT